jgi:hypothetical protein
VTGPHTTDVGVRSGDGPRWLGYVPLTVDAHVRSGSTLEVSLHPAEARVVVSIAGSNNAAVHLFAPRAELVRLIEVATAGLAELDAAIAATEDAATGADTAGTESAA